MAEVRERGKAAFEGNRGDAPSFEASLTKGESIFSLDDPSPNRLGFDLKRLMRTKYRIDDFQQNYFVIDSFEDLLTKTMETDFGPIYAEMANEPDIEIETILPTDRVYTLGSFNRPRPL